MAGSLLTSSPCASSRAGSYTDDTDPCKLLLHVLPLVQADKKKNPDVEATAPSYNPSRIVINTVLWQVRS